MRTDTIEVQTEHGTMPVHTAHPDTDGQPPLVVLFMDAPGIRDALFGHAQRLNTAGYATALPDLYYRLDPADRPEPERLRSGDELAFARMGRAVATLSDDDVITDTRLMLDRLASDHPASAGWGVVGFCAGGRFGLRAATALGDQLRAASLLHPSRLVTDEQDSPHRMLDGATAGLYLGFGENDHVTPLSVIPPLREQLESHEIEHTIEVIPAADHGFTMPGMPAYNADAAERAWAGTLALLKSRL